MKKFALITLWLTSTFVFAQLGQMGQLEGGKEPVEWSSKAKKISDNEYELTFRGYIEEGWHIYSQFTAEGGSQPSEFIFENVNVDYELIGKAEESKTYTEYSDVFEIDETFFKEKAIFKQKIKLLKPINVITVELNYQACLEVCIQKNEVFTFSLDGSKVTPMPQELTDHDIAETEKLKLDIKNPELVRSCDDDGTKKSLWGIFILGFLGGLLALLTPCVFPMIPLTVSFFTKQSENKGKGIFNAILYGLFIVIIYLLLSIPFHLMDSVEPEILNNISTNVYLNVIFFVIFIFFAGSFFGYYELTLPSSWVNKMDSASTKAGGFIGIFFMAMTLALVSFSCTGPILGSLLAGSIGTDGNAAMQLTSGMAGFGVALALPFALFAMFPGLMNSLPKSGGWLNTTKVVLGFVELALAFKFLSKADLVMHWGLIKREVFLGLWVLIFIGLALYLFGKIKFPHDSPIKKLSFSRISFAVLVTAFVIYLIPGLWGKNLKLISGFPPPMFYSLFEQESKCPLGLECYKDFEEGVAVAKQKNKPILLDFTGWGCENCRQMEESVWSEDKVFQIIDDNYILISLYVDDKEQLPEDKKFKFLKPDGKIKKIRTIGDKWATFQVVNFKAAAQPDYRLLTPDGLELLNCGQNKTDTDTYHDWLKAGLDQFKK
ncbi:MAG: thioredoxin family protein [Flavobacteriaceae bacterium]|nr:thioredoxin family protein [Flavobacteriaceae bacterium]